MSKRKINVIVLTGFLGAGKTTVLNNLLACFAGDQNMIIENEFGSVSVDSGLVQTREDRIFELNNGCICCTLGEELYAVLREMVRMENPPENVFIEASGMADPGALASVFVLETVSEYFYVSKVIGVADAGLFEDSLEEIPESGRQLAVADLILLNKADTVSSGYIAILKDKLKRINPLASIYTTNFGEINPDMMQSSPESPAKLVTLPKEETPHEHSNVKSIALDFEGQLFDLDRLRSILTVSLFLHYHQIYRIKGYVYFQGHSRPFLIQSVGQQLQISPVYDKLPQRCQILIVIGKGITTKGLKKLLNKGLLNES